MPSSHAMAPGSLWRNRVCATLKPSSSLGKHSRLYTRSHGARTALCPTGIFSRTLLPSREQILYVSHRLRVHRGIRFRVVSARKTKEFNDRAHNDYFELV